MRRQLIISTLFFLIPLLAAAEVYKYTDKAGKVHFVSEQSQIPEEYSKNAVDSSAMRPITKVPAQKFYRAEMNKVKLPSASGNSTRSTARRVEIYVTSWCPYCKQLEDFLRKNKIPFSRYDVERDSHGKIFYAGQGYGGVPITKIGNNVIRGFKPDEILSAAGA